MTYPIRTKRFVFHVEIVPTRPSIPQLTHISSTASDLPLFSYVGTLNFLRDSRRVLNDGVKKVSFWISALMQAILRGLSQWPSGWFKVPAMLQWHVVATEPRVIEEIRKATDTVFSSQEAIEEVSSFHSITSPRGSAS